MGSNMKCDRCNSQIQENDVKEYAGRRLCEDCYMDVLSPARPCDPWAVYAAKSMGGSNAAILTKTQEKILKVLKETNGIELEPLADRVGLGLSELHREIATLRHMEKLRAVMQEDKKVFCVWH